MAEFGLVLENALRLAGGRKRLEARLPVPRSAEELAATGDDRYLSTMCLRIFRAGLRHALVDAKWPAFEEVFFGFEPRRVAMMSDEELDRCVANRALIRHWTKLSSVRGNAAEMCRKAREHGSFGSWLAEWPAGDIVSLWERLAKDFSHLGGNSAPSFLRMAGKDTFVLTGDVVQGLIDNGVVERTPTSKAARRRVQAAFNAWVEETGRPLCQLSMILALSVESG